jgi:tripartite-type tricarboxylate transporter receptor subunit TctC
MRRRDLVTIGLVAVVSRGFAPRFSFAQGVYPTRPIRLIIPFPPGGGFDAIGRPWAEKIQPLLGTVVVENEGVGAVHLELPLSPIRNRTATPSCWVGRALTSPEAILKTRPLYDPIRDFEPISNIAVSAFAIAVNPSIPANTLQEFIDYDKANRGKLSYGHAGVGSLNHLTGELFKSLAGLPDLVQVPYRGSGPATADTIAGHVAMVTPAVTGQLIAYHRTGKLRILAVTSPARLAAAPDLPTAVETLPGMTSQQSIGLFAPARTPTAIIEQIALANHNALAEPDYQKMLIETGFVPDLDSSPAKFQRIIEDEIIKWTPIVRALDIKID